MKEEDGLQESMSKKRFWLAIGIIGASMVLLFLAIAFGCTKVNWDTVFTAIVGLVGTWVGTVLAFYFSKENFDAASASTQKLVDSITSKDKLNKIKVKEAMIPIGSITFLTLDKAHKDFFLKDLIEKNLKDYNRLPILNTDGTIFGIAHKSLIVEFIANKAIAGETTSTLSLEDLLKNTDTKYEQNVKNGFSTIKEDEPLGQAKKQMEDKTTRDVICTDVFVTEDGTPKTKVTGWLTNIEITKNAMV